MYFLVMKWMKNEASLVLHHSRTWACGLSSGSSKLLLSFCFHRIWPQVLLYIKSNLKGRVESKRGETEWFFPRSSFEINNCCQAGLPQMSPLSPIILRPHVELPLIFMILGKSSRVH